jgi:hypothetical protein
VYEALLDRILQRLRHPRCAAAALMLPAVAYSSLRFLLHAHDTLGVEAEALLEGARNARSAGSAWR